MLCTRRELVAGVCALYLGGRRAAHAADKPAPEPDQGIVLCSWAADDASISGVEFRQFHSRPILSFGRTQRGEIAPPSTAKLGQYYFYACESAYANVGKTVYREPDERSTFEILNGVVNYIGDWSVTQKGPEVATRLATIARAKKKYPWLAHYQLFVSFPGRESSALSWGQLPEPPGS
jgi:hypothetical protein